MSTERCLTAFLFEVQKRGTDHRLVDLYLLKLVEAEGYCHPFRYYVAYEAAEHVGPEEAEEHSAILNAYSAECIMRGELSSPGGDPSGYEPTHPALLRGYTAAVVRLAEEVAYSRHEDCENPEPVLEKAMRDFAHNLHWSIAGAGADLYEYEQQNRTPA